MRVFVVSVALVAGCLSMPPRPDPGGPFVDAPGSGSGSGSGFDGSVTAVVDLAVPLAEGALAALALP